MRYTWDGIENPYDGFIREARLRYNRVDYGMSSWRGMRWGFSVITADGLQEVQAGDTVEALPEGGCRIERKVT